MGCGGGGRATGIQHSLNTEMNPKVSWRDQSNLKGAGWTAEIGLGAFSGENPYGRPNAAQESGEPNEIAAAPQRASC